MHIHPIESLPESDMETYVFTTLSVWSAEHARVQRLIESGELMVYDQVNTEFVTCVQAFALARIICGNFASSNWDKYTSPSTRAFVSLLSDLDGANTGTVWERIVLFTIASRANCKMELQHLFGIDEMLSDQRRVRRSLNIQFDNKIPCVGTSSSGDGSGLGNVLLIPRDGQAGFDGLVLLDGQVPSRWYTHMKLSRPSKPLAAVLSSVICQCLLDHSQRSASIALGEVHIVVYIWEDTEPSWGSVTQDSVIPLISDQVQQMLNTSAGVRTSPGGGGFNLKYVMDYVTNHWCNIHIVGEKGLREWLPPSFIPFPILFARVENVTIN